MDPLKVVVPSTRTVAVVENLTPSNAYHFRVLAENSIGLSEPSDVIQITTHEEGENSFILSVSITLLFASKDDLLFNSSS